MTQYKRELHPPLTEDDWIRYLETLPDEDLRDRIKVLRADMVGPTRDQWHVHNVYEHREARWIEKVLRRKTDPMRPTRPAPGPSDVLPEEKREVERRIRRHDERPPWFNPSPVPPKEIT